MNIEIKFADARKLNECLKRAVQKVPSAASRFLKMEAEIVRGRTVMKTPVDTGRLRGSWEAQSVSNFEAQIGNNTEYAAFVEFGHRIFNPRTKKPTGKIAKGFFMLRDGLEESAGSFEADAQMIFKEIFS